MDFQYLMIHDVFFWRMHACPTILLLEFSMIKWHVVCFFEMRCLSEDVFLEGGYRFISSFIVAVAFGVAILIY